MKRANPAQLRQSGYDQAKHQHEAGIPIEMILLGFRTMPASHYANGGLEYVTEQLAKEPSQ